jgi:hypothetical protein
MYVQKFCTSCKKVSRTYKNPNTRYIEKFCLSCYRTKGKQERIDNEFNWILGIIKEMKD